MNSFGPNVDFHFAGIHFSQIYVVLEYFKILKYIGVSFKSHPQVEKMVLEIFRLVKIQKDFQFFLF